MYIKLWSNFVVSLIFIYYIYYYIYYIYSSARWICQPTKSKAYRGVSFAISRDKSTRLFVVRPLANRERARFPCNCVCQAIPTGSDSETRIPLSMRVSYKPCLEVNDTLEITANLFVLVSKLSSTTPNSIITRLDKDDCLASFRSLLRRFPALLYPRVIR